MKLITWPIAIVIVALVGGLVVLAVLDVDTGLYLALAVAILVGLGIIHSQGEIKSGTNGNMSRLISLVETMASQLRQLPPLPPLPPEPPPNGEEHHPSGS